MIRVAILVEGLTEGEFIKRILACHLLKRNVSVVYRDLGGGGGVHKIAREIRQYCRSFDVVTSLVDYYGFRNQEEASVEELEERVGVEARAISDQLGSILGESDRLSVERVSEVAHAKYSHMIRMRYRNRISGGGNCEIYPYVQRHEFEGLLFSDVESFGRLPDVTVAAVRRLKRIRDQFQTPEDINDSPTLAPSKRIKKIIPTYQKVVNGVDLAEWITLAKIRRECKRFNAWVAWLESLSEETV